MARALVRPITRKNALSYDRTYPNGRGVTALAEVNGRGAYARRYKQAERILRSAKRARVKARHGGVMARRRKKLRGAAKKAFVARMRRGRRAAGYRTNVGTASAYGASRQKAYGAGWDKAFKKKKKRSTGGPRVGRTKAQRGVGTLRTPVNPYATRKRHKPARKSAAVQKPVRKRRRRLTHVYGGGRFHTIVARVGRKRRSTYAYVTKKGNVRKVPLYAQLGFTSAIGLRRALAKGDARAARLQTRLDRKKAARARAAERASKRILAGRDIYVPNRRRKRRKTVTFEEWQMRANAKRRKRKSASKRRRATTRRRSTIRRRRRPTVRRKRRTSRRRYRANPRKSRKGKRKRKSRKLTPGQRLYRARRMRKRVAKYLRRTAKSVRRGRHSRRNIARHLSSMATSVSRTKFNNNRRRRRSYRRNFAGAFVANLKEVLRFGAVGLVGYGAHRALTKLVDENVTAKIGFLNGPTVGPYRQLISGLVTAALGIIGVAKFAPAKHAQTIGGGMGVSFLQQLLLTVLGKLGSTGAQVAPYLSAYPDDGSAAYNGFGSYYTFRPHNVYPSQLRAGVGSMPLLQAAAGIGEYEVVPGFGEYLESANTGLIQGSAGFGSDGLMDEGIAPNLYSAEQALNVAEAAAGMGDLSLVSTVDPMMQAVAVPDEPGGSRSGVLAGRDGVFG